MAQGQAARATREAVPPVSRVAIIGGGISGLAAAKQMAAYDPVVFEATPSVGGVWKHCVYRTTRLQTPRPDYEFSDYSWKNRDDPSFPTHTEIVDYLEGYADEFDLWRYISFGSKVVDIKFLGGAEAGFTELWSGTGKAPLRGKPMWEVGIVTGDSNTVQYYKFEFVVMCTGKYGDVPRMPVFPPGKGPEVFKGTVMHSLDYCKLSEEETVELMRGKKVVVVGYKKSAIDLANECAQANQAVRGVEVHRVVPVVEAAAGQVRSDAGPPLRRGLRQLPDGHPPGGLLRHGGPRPRPLPEGLRRLVLLRERRGPRRRHQGGGRPRLPRHRLRGQGQAPRGPAKALPRPRRRQVFHDAALPWHDPSAHPEHGVRRVRGERVQPAHVRAAVPVAVGAAGGAVRATVREGHDGARRRRGRRHAPHHAVLPPPLHLHLQHPRQRRHVRRPRLRHAPQGQLDRRALRPIQQQGLQGAVTHTAVYSYNSSSTSL
ncbi:uncharacterized protein [Aegilops tauschii subsp. strangulata]|nr:uncharacterized protein LOC123100347 isoform X2 [Triticum aestivum]XP_045083921.1 uncharacterized protein LOC109779581 isoform X2 [Aegilops tauschii subsp. strangulata]